MPLPPWSASPLHGTRRQAGKHVCGSSMEETPGQAAPEAKPKGLSSLLGRRGCEAEALGTRRGIAVLSISPEGSGLGRHRAGRGRGGALVRPCPLLPSQGPELLGSVTQQPPTGGRTCYPSQGLGVPQYGWRGDHGGPLAGGSAIAPPSHLRSHSPAGHCCLSSRRGPLWHRQTDQEHSGHQRASVHPSFNPGCGRHPLPGGPRAQLCLSFSEDPGERDRVWRTESMMALVPNSITSPSWSSVWAGSQGPGLFWPLLQLHSFLLLPAYALLASSHSLHPLRQEGCTFHLCGAVGRPGPRAQFPEATSNGPNTLIQASRYLAGSWPQHIHLQPDIQA